MLQHSRAHSRQGGTEIKLKPIESVSMRSVAAWHSLGAWHTIENKPALLRLVSEGKAELVYTKNASSTVGEKANAAAIGREAVLKTVVCSDADDGIHLVISASDRRINLLDAMEQQPGMEENYFSLAERTPPSMMPGTCTPFVTRDELGQVGMIIFERPRNVGQEVDVAVGGTDELSRHLSVRVKLGDLVNALSEEYGGKLRFFARSVRTEVIPELPGWVKQPLQVASTVCRNPRRASPRVKALQRLEKKTVGLETKQLEYVVGQIQHIADNDVNSTVRDKAAETVSKLSEQLGELRQAC